LSNSYKHKPVLKISAAVVKQLGEELVPDAVTAIMELVKNAYDADADWVKITINTKDTLEGDYYFSHEPGFIIIEDNGEGMNYDDINNKWLFISVSHKRDMKEKGQTTKVKHRTPLGDKGLGRLSAQRLGYALELRTGQSGELIMHHVALNWKEFREDVPLNKIDTRYRTSTKAKIKKGTSLIISNLLEQQIWESDAADRFRGQLSKLIFPYKDKRPFAVYLNINGQPIDLDELSERLREQAISQYQLSFNGTELTLTGSVKLTKLVGNSNADKEIFNNLIAADQGKLFFSFLTDSKRNKEFLTNIEYKGKKGILFTFKRTYDFEKDLSKYSVINATTRKAEPANPGLFFGEIDEFNLNSSDSILSAFDSLSEYKNLVKNQVGVRIFRDGFGIVPYGMEDNDWLKLKKGQTSGGSFYTLRPENIIGFISISASQNRNLIEKTDRGGFIDNAYSKNFFSIIGKSIDDINDILEKTRRSYIEFKKQSAGVNAGIISYKDSQQQIAETGKEAKILKKETEKIHHQFSETSKNVKSAIYSFRNEPLFNRPEDLKSLKLLEKVDSLLDDANGVLERVNNILEAAQKLEDHANYLGPQLEQFETQLYQISELAGLGITAEAFTHELYNIIDRVGNQTDNIIKQLKKDNQVNPNFFIYTEHIKSFIVAIRRQLNHLAPSLRFNRETKQKFDIETFLQEIKEYYFTRFEDKIKISIKVKDSFNVNVNKGKLTQIVDNILLNSEYWLNEKLKNNSDFRPEILIEIKDPFITIWDNGFGISPTLNETIFQPFVSTKRNGRGLGLFIVQQLLDSINGEIVLLSQKNQFDRRFKFQINLEQIIVS